MVDLYSQIYAQDDITGDWAANAATCCAMPMSAADAPMRGWPRCKPAVGRRGRGPGALFAQVLTAYAAARMPVERRFAGDAPDLDRLDAGGRARWQCPALGGRGPMPVREAWALLVLAAPQRAAPVERRRLGSVLRQR
jgi:hypothetical protein